MAFNRNLLATAAAIVLLVLSAPSDQAGAVPPEASSATRLRTRLSRSTCRQTTSSIRTFHSARCFN